MRVPPSVIVMSVIVAVPFGLGLRDSLRHHPVRADEDALDFDGSRAAARARAQRYAEVQREEEDQTRAEVELAASAKIRVTRALPRLFGAKPAALGEVFDGVQLGAPASSFQPETTRAAIAELTDGSNLSVAFDVDGERLNAVTVRLDDDCSPLERALVQAWPASTERMWVDAASHQRATFNGSTCAVKFEKFADVDAWIDRTTTAIVALGVIGKPAQALRDRLRLRLTDDSEDQEGHLTWHDRGIGLSATDTTITATIAHDNVVGLTVETDTDPATRKAVVARLTKLYGVKPVDAEGGGSSWRGNPPVTLAGDAGPASLTLSIGAP